MAFMVSSQQLVVRETNRYVNLGTVGCYLMEVRFMNPLENPIWSALSSAHAHLAEGDGLARRYPREITTMGAFAGLPPRSEAWDSLARLLEPKETIAVLFKAAPEIPNGWETVREVEIVQMVHDGKTKTESKRVEKVVALGAAESAEIVELAKLTNPGPIGPRSYEIGNFIGIRNDKSQLIAMAGERFRFPDYCEVSGVCTRPGFEGRGLAAQLVVEVMARIQKRGEIPYLHSRADNERAVKLYERLGFVLSRSFPMRILRKL
jgi:ribosomal protein S18 acetylase RimI-like enzyme